MVLGRMNDGHGNRKEVDMSISMSGITAYLSSNGNRTIPRDGWHKAYYIANCLSITLYFTNGLMQRSEHIVMCIQVSRHIQNWFESR